MLWEHNRRHGYDGLAFGAGKVEKNLGKHYSRRTLIRSLGYFLFNIKQIVIKKCEPASDL